MNPSPDAPEMWAGVECTVNRVGDLWFDQMERNGHARRADDLDRVAALGVRTMRYPLLWERMAPEDPSQVEWGWADDRMARMQGLGITPVVGLCHHGSGPRYTSLSDRSFATGLADFACRVAERYPWAVMWTPVNEPLTTARFSGLYGHWHPHGRDARTFARCLLNQCRAVVLAMRAIRAVQPDARLVQTEDLGRSAGTPPLQYQADFENERRWLTFDLLSGRVVRGHAMWDYLRRVGGVSAAELAWFADNPCPPDVVGVNHYLTSERWLDHRLDRYPPSLHGGNGRHTYADVEAVRVRPEGLAGPEALLREAWERYGRPVAVTEAHLGCTREEQLRWLAEVWRAACSLRRAGADVVAVTAWSLFGAFDWDSLVTRDRGHYEPGAFDVRSDPPRPTALAGLVAELAAGREPSHPALDVPGWWHRPARLLFGGPPATPFPLVGRPLLVAGTCPLGRTVARACEGRGLPYRVLAGVDEDDLTGFEPWAVVAAGGSADAEACARRGVRLLTFAANAPPGTLAVPSASPGLDLVHAALDLLVDGETGFRYPPGSPAHAGFARASADEALAPAG